MQTTVKSITIEEKALIDIKMHEYQWLCAENLQSMSNRNSILTFGLATLGLIFGAGVISLQQQNLLAFLIFTVIIPFLSLILLVLWIGEVERMTRVGGYLVDFENSINKFFGENAEILQWETWLRKIKSHKKTPQLLYPYNAVIALFFGIAVLSPLMYLLVYKFAITPRKLGCLCETVGQSWVIINQKGICLTSYLLLGIFL